mgnify:CR=1 FL=1
MVENVLQKLIDLFTSGGAKFRVLEHEASGKSSLSVAQIRGTQLGQGAKALVCHVKGNGLKLYVLTKLAQALGARRASLASPVEVADLTGCVFGAVPPVSFHPQLKLVADPTLYTRYDELAFNAGELDHSIIIATEDYKRIVNPQLIDFLKEPVPNEVQPNKEITS